MEPSAKVIADSVAPNGARLTTMQVVMHRFVLAEFNTHRKFSRNSASSRAIPIQKQIRRVLDEPAMPIEWGSNQPGMQAGEQLDDDSIRRARLSWLKSRDDAVKAVQALDQLGLHKQVANRLLEPFMWHTAIVSATEWDNFFAQRCSPLAQPEIRVVAEAMREALDASEPTLLKVNEWHTPYIQPDERNFTVDDRIALSVARCARVSYLTHEGHRDHNADFDLYDRLVTSSPPHASPLEHVATPLISTDVYPSEVSGNFDGWGQWRHIYPRLESSIKGTTEGKSS